LRNFAKLYIEQIKNSKEINCVCEKIKNKVNEDCISINEIAIKNGEKIFLDPKISIFTKENFEIVFRSSLFIFSEKTITINRYQILKCIKKKESRIKIDPQIIKSKINNINSKFKVIRDIGCFDLISKIDEGTFGIVFRTKDRSSGYSFALKKVKLIDKNFICGLPVNSIREINIMSLQKQINIVGLIEVLVGNTMNNVYIVLEFMEHDLKIIMEKMMKKSFAVNETKNIMIQLFMSVGYLHTNWIIHRDIKSSNILYNNCGEVRLCDFGLSKYKFFNNQIKTPIVVTPFYRAPELFLGENKYSTEVDLWSCGCIMGELIV